MTPRSSRAAAAFAVVLAVVVGALIPAGGATATAAPWDEPQAPVRLTVGQLPAPRDVADLDSAAARLAGADATADGLPGPGRRSAADLDVRERLGLGKVESSAAARTSPYAGPALEAAESYVWRVRTWDGADVASPWSAHRRVRDGAGGDWGDIASRSGSTPPQRTWTDYTLEGDFAITAQNASIVFRAQDPNNYLMWQFRGDGVEHARAAHPGQRHVHAAEVGPARDTTLVNNTDLPRSGSSTQGSTIRT